jgi:hypothetical protein
MEADNGSYYVDAVYGRHGQEEAGQLFAAHSL